MPDMAIADAPGRVNLIGEHTDYHEGYVLPTVIPQRTHVEVVRRDDRRVRASSDRVDGLAEYELGAEALRRDWSDYVQGVTAMLARAGVEIPGFDLRVTSNVPVGAGVSSSAALEVSLLRALRALTGAGLDDLTIARIAQQAETDFVGAPVGIMDQVAASLGRDREALFLDTRTLHIERIPLPSSVDLVVIDSAVPHAHASGEYAARRRESFEAARRLNVTHLRDVVFDAFPCLYSLPPVLRRRARHVVTENQRVLEAVQALRADDPERLGTLFAASHASMRDDYETSTPEVNTLVAIAQRHRDVYGARLTGGGFGGAIVALARRGRGAALSVAVRDEYIRATGLAASVLVPQGVMSAAT